MIIQLINRIKMCGLHILSVLINKGTGILFVSISAVRSFCCFFCWVLFQTSNGLQELKILSWIKYVDLISIKFSSIKEHIIAEIFFSNFDENYIFFFFFAFLLQVNQILYRQNFCQFSTSDVLLQKLLTSMTCNLLLTAMNVSLLSWTVFFEINDFIISVTISRQSYP